MEIHPTAIVGRGAVLGEETTVGPYTVIGDRVVLGVECRVGSHVVIEGPVEICDR